MATSQASDVIQHLRRAVFLRDGAGLTDGQLLESFRARRDAAGMEVLVRRHGPMVWGVCRRVLHNRQDAEVAFQATFLVLVRRAASIAPHELLAKWPYGVAHRTALKARAAVVKRKGRERQVTVMPEPAVADQDLWGDLRPLLDHELSRLPDKYRAVIVLCDLEGRTRTETARQLGPPEGTVGSRLARVRAMLAKRLTQRGVALSGGALAAGLSQKLASAGVPTSLMSSTIKAAGPFAAGQASAVPVKFAALTEGVLRTMLLSKLKNAAALLLVVSFLTPGAAAVISRTSAAEQPEKGEAAKKAEKERADKEAVPSASDRGEAKIVARWEYKALSHDEIKAMEFKRAGIDSLESGLNELGRQGWGLVAIGPPAPGPVPNVGGRPALHVFKRQKK